MIFECPNSDNHGRIEATKYGSSFPLISTADAHVAPGLTSTATMRSKCGSPDRVPTTAKSDWDTGSTFDLACVWQASLPFLLDMQMSHHGMGGSCNRLCFPISSMLGSGGPSNDATRRVSGSMCSSWTLGAWAPWGWTSIEIPSSVCHDTPAGCLAGSLALPLEAPEYTGANAFSVPCLGQLQASRPDFLLHPWINGLRLSQTARTVPPSVHNCAAVVDEIFILGVKSSSRAQRIQWLFFRHSWCPVRRRGNLARSVSIIEVASSTPLRKVVSESNLVRCTMRTTPSPGTWDSQFVVSTTQLVLVSPFQDQWQEKSMTLCDRWAQSPPAWTRAGSPSRFRKQPPRHNPVSVRRGRQTDPLDKFNSSGDSTNVSPVTGVCVNATLESAVPLGCRTQDQLRAVPSFRWNYRLLDHNFPVRGP